MVSISPRRDSDRSTSERVNSSNSAAITARAVTISSSISLPVAEEVSSEMVAGDRLLASSGLELPCAMSRRASSVASSRCPSSILWSCT